MPFTVATWNVLASAYVTRDRYPGVDESLLVPEARDAAAATYLGRLRADLAGLQEVEEPMFAAMSATLGPLGWEGRLERKGRGRPDGCATFARRDRFDAMSFRRIDYDDGDPPSGHVALVTTLEHDGRRLGFANTHVKWDPPGSTPEQRFAIRQINRLLSELHSTLPPCDGWIVCGDFNAELDDDAVRLLRDAGFTPTHMPSAGATCNPNGKAKMIDFVFVDHALQAESHPLVPVEDGSVLPSREIPSDHVPVVATIRWR